MTTAHKVIGALAIISVLLSGSIVYISSQNNKLRNKITMLEAHYANQELVDSTAHNPIQSIDEMLFAGRYTDALQKYQDLRVNKTSAVDDTALIARISVVRNLIANTISSRVDKPTQAAPDSIAAPATSVDHTDLANRSSRNNKDTDSLKNKITELNRRLSSRERALEEKEQLKAMAIQGPTGQTIQYVGDTKNGMAHGTGTGVWDASGGTYNGDWQQNKRHGYGVYNWKDGVRYEGEFRQDKREGKGSYYWPSGERYVGLWKNNQRHGHGVLYDKDGNVSYDGNWESDKPKRK